jgi:uncharacterized protein
MSRKLLIHVKDLPEEGLELSIDQREPSFGRALNELQEGEAVGPTGKASFQVALWPDRLDVQGSIEVWLSQRCSRCASSFAQTVERDYLRVFLRAAYHDDAEETELSNTDLDREELVNDRLDLRIVLGEELLLALPSKPLCMDDCRGICAGCGAELNEQECSCKPEVDERWAALKALSHDS